MKLKVLAGAALVLPGLALAGAAPAQAATRHPSITIAANHRSIHLGSAVTISGKVSPNRHGRHVTLQRHYGGAWHQDKTATLSRSSHYTLRVKPTHTGVWSYRVHYAAQKGWAAADSEAVSIKVTHGRAKSAPPAISCHPLSNSGTCYEPGEFCRSTDHGVRGVAGDGEAIECEDNNGWRWEPV
jgi:hypothetical protein